MIIPFEREHLREMLVQTKQKSLPITEEILDTLELGEGYTYFDEKPLACAGVIEIADGRALAWAYMAESIGSKMPVVIRGIKRFLSMSTYRRIEMDVDCDFPQAHRMARILGFTQE